MNARRRCQQRGLGKRSISGNSPAQKSRPPSPSLGRSHLPLSLSLLRGSAATNGSPVPLVGPLIANRRPYTFELSRGVAAGGRGRGRAFPSNNNSTTTYRRREESPPQKRQNQSSLRATSSICVYFFFPRLHSTRGLISGLSCGRADLCHVRVFFVSTNFFSTVAQNHQPANFAFRYNLGTRKNITTRPKHSSCRNL